MTIEELVRTKEFKDLIKFSIQVALFTITIIRIQEKKPIEEIKTEIEGYINNIKTSFEK